MERRPFTNRGFAGDGERATPGETPLARPLADLRAQLAAHPPPLTIAGVCPAARGLAVAALTTSDAPLLAVVPTPRDAEALHAGLALVLPHLATAVLAAEAADAYSARPVALGASSAAALELARLARGLVGVLIVPARLLIHPFPTPASLAQRTLVLRGGGRLAREEAIADLVGQGYRRVFVASEAGELAARGEIFDVCTREGCARAVLEVDRIDSLRAFDPVTQRSLPGELDEFSVPPLRLFPSDTAARQRLAARLERDGFGEAASAVLAGLKGELWEDLLALAHDAVPLWSVATRVVVCEPTDVLAEIERAFTAARHGWATLATRGHALPPPENWLFDRAACASALAAADRIVQLALGDSGPAATLHTAPAPSHASQPRLLLQELRRGVAERRRQVLLAASAGEEQRLEHLLAGAELALRRGWPGEGEIGVLPGTLPHGFAWREANLLVYGRNDLTTLPPPSRQRRSLAVVLADMRDLKVGDFVVHADHGVARFLGFRTIFHHGGTHECVELEYGGGGKLLVPLDRADALEKYASASEGVAPKLDRLGGGTWARTKARVKRSLRDLAGELLRTHAARELATGFAFSKDSPWQRDFEAAFEYELTPDQDAAVREVKRDMESPRPMERLLVGDVGYGKTEVAMRATFKAVLDGKQVAVLAPTTVLAAQHLRTFTRRFAGFPVEIRALSRFLPPAEQRATLAGLAEGTVDVVIGTHRLLAADVRFRDLGLVIIDEEQRFGVAQKERLKQMTAAVDVLSLSATPIPRTLNLGLVGLRDVSIIETAPRDRLAVQTHVLPFSRELLREAILTEMARGGQTFFVHNRVASIGGLANLLRDTVPEAKIVVAHGQMAERELDRAMAAFVDGRADVLLATSIIENGLDIPNANTLIVNRAERFGLAQLYQLRGRVGRSDRLAFAYFLVPPEASLSEEARARLSAIQEFAELGSGFRIAARDLEIRGAGNLLGAEQHGHMRAVGYETYCRLLEEVVHELRGEAAPPPARTVELRLGLDLKLPEEFIPDEALRLATYRRIASAPDDVALADLRAELVERFGTPPPQLDHLFLHQSLRRRGEAAGVTRIRRSPLGLEIAFDPTHPAAHAVALAVLQRVGRATLTPQGVLRLPALAREAAADAAALRDLLPVASS